MPDSSLFQHCFVLAGPTAVGKTEVAVAVAEACQGEIIGADAFQVYRGLDVLTAKPSPETLAQVPHYLVGTVPLSENFNVARYLETALRIIGEIRNRGRLPIVVGGTGLYLRALTRGLADSPPSDPALRAELEQAPLSELLARLEALDPAAAANVDRKNPRRVLRALEVVALSGKPFSTFRQEWSETPPIHGFLLERDREDLYARIDRRTVAMFDQGVVQEVREAIDAGGVGATAEQVLGWRQIGALLRGELTRAECIASLQQATRNYAKRQLTWFRREPMLRSVSLTAATDITPILESAAAVAQANGTCAKR